MTNIKPNPTWHEMGCDYVTGFMCMTDFECELGAACGGNTIYPSVDDLKRNRPCVEECGIVKVKVEGLCIIQEAAPYDDEFTA